jgi:sarcosine oxidase subunit beta
MSAEFLLSTSIYEIAQSKSKVTAVITDKGRIETRSIVIAAGAWSPEIGNTVNLDIPVRPQRGQVLVTEPLPLNKRWRYICDADYLSIAFDTDRAEESNDVRLKLGVASNYIQKSNGTWTIGSSRDFAGYNNQVSIDTTAYLVKRMMKFVPKLKGTDCIRMYAGLRPFCYIDGLPIISNVSKLSGLFIATGHAGEGITLAPITGKLITELIIDNKSSMSIDAFSFSRFQNEAV